MTHNNDKRMFVYGASGHGKVVADILLTGGTVIDGFIDDSPSVQSTELLGIKVAGHGDWLLKQASIGPVAVVLGIGDNFAREEVANRCAEAHIEILTAVHPSAIVSPSVRLGPGVVVMAGAAINPDAQIEAGAIINTGAIVEHDCRVGEFAHLSPNAAMGGGSELGRLSWLGIGASVIHGVKVGSQTIIGAGAVVVCDIPGGVIATGIPARIRRHL